MNLQNSHLPCGGRSSENRRPGAPHFLSTRCVCFRRSVPLYAGRLEGAVSSPHFTAPHSPHRPNQGGVGAVVRCTPIGVHPTAPHRGTGSTAEKKRWREEMTHRPPRPARVENDSHVRATGAIAGRPGPDTNGPDLPAHAEMAQQRHSRVRFRNATRPVVSRFSECAGARPDNANGVSRCERSPRVSVRGRRPESLTSEFARLALDRRSSSGTKQPH